MDETNISTSSGEKGHSAAQRVAPKIWVPVATIAATFLAFVSTLALGFVFDDHVLIVENGSIQSWRYFPQYFTSHIWFFRYPHLLANYYRPLFLTWLRVNDMLFGLHPWGWHLTSVLAHLVVTYLVYCLALRLTRSVWTAGAIGIWFGVDPAHVEAVADITSIQEPLSTILILGGLLAFIRSRESDQPTRWMAISLLSTAAALLSKESGMILPILIAGYAWIFEPEGSSDSPRLNSAASFIQRSTAAIWASVPYWCVVLAYVPLRIHALKGFAHVISPISRAQQFYTLPSVLNFYARLLLAPLGMHLSCYYDMPYVSAATWSGFAMPLFDVLLAAAWIVLFYWWASLEDRREANAMAFSAFWMVASLIPVLNFRYLPAGEIAHDRYVYLASVGAVILTILEFRRFLTYLVKQHPEVKAKFPGPVGWEFIIPLAFVILSFGYSTTQQTLYWSDDLTLNFHAREVAPKNVYATTSLASALADRGMDSQAIALYQQALNTQPDFWRANVNLGYLYYAQGDYPHAAEYFSRASASDPTDGDQFLYLGMALLRMGKFPQAESAVQTALLVRPEGKNYHLGLGMVLKAEGKLPAAALAIEADLAQHPDNAQARDLLNEVNREMQPGTVDQNAAVKAQ